MTKNIKKVYILGELKQGAKKWRTSDKSKLWEINLCSYFSGVLIKKAKFFESDKVKQHQVILVASDDFMISEEIIFLKKFQIMRLVDRDGNFIAQHNS